MPNKHQIFLSYASADKDAARDIYRTLGGAGINVWFDEASIVPGSRWDHAITNELEKSNAVVFLVGPNPPGQWQIEELNSIFRRTSSDSDFKLIPVLLPGADIDAWPEELRIQQAVDLRHTDNIAKELLKLLRATQVESGRSFSEEDKSKIEAAAMGELADRLQTRGDLDEALRIRREEQLPIFEKLGDTRSRAITLGRIADVLQLRGDLDEALRIRREEELPVYERLGDVRSRAVTLGQIADILLARGELDEALRIRREEQLPVFERLGDIRELAVTVGQIADILQLRGDLDEALRIRREEELPVYERLGDVRSRAVTLGQVANILQKQGAIGDAISILRDEVIPVFDRMGDVRSALVARSNLALILLSQREVEEQEEAVNLLRHALKVAEQIGLPERETIRKILESSGLKP